MCPRAAAASAAARIAALDLLPATTGGLAWSCTDIRSESALSTLAREWSAPVVVHLAALAEVVMPFGSMSGLTATNVQGTINVLAAFDPQRLVFASSSAAYGNVHGGGARPTPEQAAAIGAYGASKVMGEIICAEWAAERGSSAVALRFGNIVGPGCRGLVPYLVSHALKHPDGAHPAQLRGQGRLVRDYVTVDCAVDVILKACDCPLAAGESAIFNVGSGRGLTNAQVAHRVADVLRARGYRIELNFGNPVPRGESDSVVLDVSETARRLGVPPPTAGEVARAIDEATDWHLSNMLGKKV